MTKPAEATNDEETMADDVSPDAIADIINNVAVHPRADHGQLMRIAEALLFAAGEPLGLDQLAEVLPQGSDIEAILTDLQQLYADRGVNLVEVAGRWTFRTSEDLSFLLRREASEEKRLSRVALETAAIIAYHQPVTRAEIEEVRGVAVSKGTLDVLLDLGWVRMRGRRRTPGKPLTYGTTDAFLEHFGLADIKDLPGLEELKSTGLLSSNLPRGFSIPLPNDDGELQPDEMSLEDDEDQPPLEMHLPDVPEIEVEDK